MFRVVSPQIETGDKITVTIYPRKDGLKGGMFLRAKLADGTEKVMFGNPPRGVEWFNTATNRWDVLWQSKVGDNWRTHQGRILVRKLANGKTMVLPVRGL